MKKNIISNILFVVAILVPAFFVFRAIFISGPLAYGDAPHFWIEELKELLAEPYAWTSRGNNFGGVNSVLWLSPLMFLYGLLNRLFVFGNDLIIRILFYIPAIVLSITGIIFFTRHLKYSRFVQFVATFLYLFNTYFILLIDGGQVGIALAYGIFPWAILYLRKLVADLNWKIFIAALISTFLLTMADPRIAIISLLAIIVWGLLERNKGLIRLIPLIISLLGLSSYWLIPLVKSNNGSLFLDASNSQFMSFLNPLLLFSSHWPANIFGKVSLPNWYFLGLPVLIVLGLFRKPRVKYLNMFILFLFFSFLAKGITSPFGGLYSWLITNIPFGISFRDSSKFLIPVILFAGILIGVSIDFLQEKIKSNRFGRYAFVGVFYLYLMFLVSPAILGKMNFVLSDRAYSNDLKIIRERLASEDNYFRTAWFPERHPMTFETEDKPALDAKAVVNLRSIALLNVGSFDAFNYMNNKSFLDWYDVLGIKYLIYPGDQRVIDPNEEETINWNNLLELTANTEGLERVNWGTNIPIYENTGALPRIFGVNSLLAIIGSQTDGQGLTPAIYFEDGLFAPRDLEGVASDSATLVFNDKDKTDLMMSFLQEHFIGPQSVNRSEWAVYSANDYLAYKYQLLIRDLEISDFDYEQGIAFSTNKGEEMEFSIDIPKDGEFIMLVRSMGPNQTGLEVSINGQKNSIERKRINNFEWFVKPLILTKGKQNVVVKNFDGFQVVNVIALVSKEDFVEAEISADVFIEHFGVTGQDKLEKTLEDKIISIDYEMINPTKYNLGFPEDTNWIIFTDSYHKDWMAKKGRFIIPSLPVYSTVNIFYHRSEWDTVELVFAGQEQIRWGLLVSVMSLLTLTISFLWFTSKKS